MFVVWLFDQNLVLEHSNLSYILAAHLSFTKNFYFKI